MQINGIGNNQIGNTYQNPNRMPNSATGKKEEDEVSKRLEALGVKVELSFQQQPAQEQEVAKEAADVEQPQESFSVLTWVRKIWEAGIAWLKSIWNDEQGQESADADIELAEPEIPDADAKLIEQEMLDAEMMSAEFPAEEAMANPTQMTEQPPSGHFDFRVTDDAQTLVNQDKFRTTGTPLHTSGMQDSYNRYGQHSKLGVEPSNNMTMRK